jgi:hypothetical protein
MMMLRNGRAFFKRLLMNRYSTFEVGQPYLDMDIHRPNKNIENALIGYTARVIAEFFQIKIAAIPKRRIIAL